MGSIIQKYNSKYLFLVFVLQKKEYTTLYLFCIPRRNLMLDWIRQYFGLATLSLSCLLSFMKIKIHNIYYNYWNAIVWIVPIYILHYIFYEFVVNTHKTLYKCEYIFEYYLINRMTIKPPNLLSEVERSIVVLDPSICASIVVTYDALLRIPNIRKP